jgi:Fe-S cluster assembly iron-binding protein IscA
VLTLTRDASDAIEGILAAPGVPDGAGIRIASAASTNSVTPSAGALQVTVAEEPGESDAVVEEAGARVFVEETVVPYLDDKLLDVEVAEDRVNFTLAERP